MLSLLVIICSHLTIGYLNSIRNDLLQKATEAVERECPEVGKEISSIRSLRALAKSLGKDGRCKGAIYTAMSISLITENRHEDGLQTLEVASDIYGNDVGDHIHSIVLLAQQASGLHSSVASFTDCKGSYQMLSLVIHSSLFINDIQNARTSAELLCTIFNSIPSSDQPTYRSVLEYTSTTDLSLLGINLVTSPSITLSTVNDYLSKAVMVVANLGIKKPYEVVLPVLVRNLRDWKTEITSHSEMFRRPLEFVVMLFCVFVSSELEILFPEVNLKDTIRETLLCTTQLKAVLNKLKQFGSQEVVQKVKQICQQELSDLSEVCHEPVVGEESELLKKNKGKKKTRRDDVISPSKRLHQTDSTGWVLSEYGIKWSGCEIATVSSIDQNHITQPLRVAKGAERIKKLKHSYVSKTTFKRRYSNIPGMSRNIIKNVKSESIPSIVNGPIDHPITPRPNIFNKDVDMSVLQAGHCSLNATSQVLSSSESNIHVMPHGRILWLFTPPSSEVQHPTSPEQLPLPRHLHSDVSAVPPSYCVQEAADVIVVPPYWFTSYICLWESITTTYKI